MLGLLLAIALLGVFHTSMDSDRLGELKFEYDQKKKFNEDKSQIVGV